MGTGRAALPVLARAAYVGVVLLATLTGLDPYADPAALGERFARALRPDLSPGALADAVRNVLLFAGWGGVWVLTRRRAGLRGATWTAFGLSAAVECVQLFSPVRTASALDLLTNTLGGWLGAAVALWVVRAIRAGGGGRPAFSFVAGAYSAAVLAEAFAPRLRRPATPLSYGGVADRLAAAAAHLASSPFHVPLGDVLLAAPAGALWAVALRGRVAVWRLAAAGAACVLGAQLARGVVGQAFEPGAAIAQLGGAACGAWLTLRALSARLLPPRSLAAAYAGLVAAWCARPPSPRAPVRLAHEPAWMHLVPLAEFRGHLDLSSVADVGGRFFLFAPIGVLLAVWPLRARGWIAGVLPGLLLAVTLEVSGALLFGSVPRATDLLVSCSAVGLGWLLVRRADDARGGECLPSTPPA